MARDTLRGVAVGVGLVVLNAWLGDGPAWAQTAETAGMITEIKVGHGKVEVKTSGADWRLATPLNTLHVGDQVRASGDASTVVLLAGGRGSARIDAKTSPYTVAGAPPDDTTSQKARSLLSASLGFLSSGSKESPKALLSTRAGPRRPEILTPRNGLVLPGSVEFEWLGSQFSRYTVRVLDPSGVVLERKGVVGARFTYPAEAPALQPGIHYRFQVEALGHPPYEAWFEIVDPTRAAAVRDDLAQLEASVGSTVSANSLAAVEAGALASQGLYHNARLVVLAALARDPDEPTLHMLLANLYLKTGLPRLAAESLDEAQFLMSREGK